MVVTESEGTDPDSSRASFTAHWLIRSQAVEPYSLFDVNLFLFLAPSPWIQPNQLTTSRLLFCNDITFHLADAFIQIDTIRAFKFVKDENVIEPADDLLC